MNADKIKPEKLDITVELATKLITEQFPNFAYLPIKPVEFCGMDNRTFHLGDEMLIRMPSAEPYSLQVSKEQKWLPVLSSYLSFSTPKPLALGRPSNYYPWNWSIYGWLDGESANILIFDDQALNHIAVDLSFFLKELHKIDVRDGPVPGLHNYWRGDHISIYDVEARSQIASLQEIIDTTVAISLWEKAISSKWDRKPVWIHGDLASGNILIKNNCLVSVIDFGLMGIGDPACDLVIAWTLFKNESRKIFKEHLGLDSDTWTRARAWALWKATFELCVLSDKASPKGLQHKYIIEEILGEYENGK